MDEQGMHDQINGEDDWAEIAGLVSLACPEPVSEIDVARLRRRVRDRIRAEAGDGASRGAKRATFLRRFCVAAAAAGFAAATLGAFVADRGATRVAPISMSRAEDGSVIIDFTDGKSLHKVVRSDDPVPDHRAKVNVARGRFVDPHDHVQPGEVVFYRID